MSTRQHVGYCIRTGLLCYRGWWPLLDELPPGWGWDSTCGSPLHMHEFATDGRSPLHNQQRALVRVKREPRREEVQSKPMALQTVDEPKQVIDIEYRRTLNELARKKFERQLLNEIRTDMMICEIEGWLKTEYLDELRRLINGIGRTVEATY